MFKKMAQRIAESTSEVIGRGVLVTDENGIIIGCNVRKRVGTFHEPSVNVMQENKPSVTGREEAKKMPGVYPGYTLPIQFFGKVIGSVSIAGIPEEVERFDEESVVMETSQGTLIVSGQGLHIEQLSLDGGELRVEGTIDALSYEDGRRERGGFFSRLLG